MRWRSPLGAALAILLAVVASPQAAAQEAQSGRISSISADGGVITLTFTGIGLPEGTLIDPDSVEVTLDGVPAPATAEPITEAVEVPTRTVILTMDTSGSMADDGKIQAARDAATTFLAALPDEVLAGVVTFSDSAALAVAPTTDRQQVQDVIQGLEAVGDTALYDATILAADSLGDEGIRSSIILSDGEDTASSTDLGTAVEAASDSGARFDAIALGAGAEGAISALTQITAGTGGSVVRAEDAEQLTSLFNVAAEAFTNELVVRAEVPADFEATSATLEVTADAGGATISDTAFITVTAAAAPTVEAQPLPSDEFGPIAAPPPPLGVPQWGFVLGVIAIGAGLAVLLWYAFGGRRDTKEEVRARLAMYSLAGATPKKEAEIRSTAFGDTAAMRAAVGAADSLVKTRNYEGFLAQRLDSAGLPLRPGEWTLLHFASAVVIGLILAVAFGFNIIAGIVGIAIGVLAPFAYLNYKSDRRVRKFHEQLPDTLQLMAGSMSAGYSLPQAVETVVNEELDPISNEFNRALAESRLGMPIEDGLEEVAARMRSTDFAWVVMAIRIQRQTGGNLAELLTTVADLMRERQQLRRQVKVLSAEGRLSAWILLGLPFVVALFVLLRNPGYLSPLITDILGWIMLGTGAVLLIVGFYWIRRVIDVEI